jgi:hypothetical protein
MSNYRNASASQKAKIMEIKRIKAEGFPMPAISLLADAEIERARKLHMLMHHKQWKWKVAAVVAANVTITA